jgi:hypothetical protein
MALGWAGLGAQVGRQSAAFEKMNGGSQNVDLLKNPAEDPQIRTKRSSAAHKSFFVFSLHKKPDGRSNVI